jgi:hypothetical protein
MPTGIHTARHVRLFRSVFLVEGALPQKYAATKRPKKHKGSCEHIWAFCAFCGYDRAAWIRAR